MAAAPGRVALLVDDNRLDQINTRGLLLGSKAGYERLDWLERWPGVDAALANGPYDLFLVDINLGVESGLDVIRDLRAAGVLQPIIALTGRNDEEVDVACTAAGASDFLVKDRVDRATFERAIRYAESQAAVHRELERLNGALERRATAENDQARLMRFAIEQSSDAILLTKAGASLGDHAVVYVNAALCALLERRAGDLLGDDVVRLLADDGMRDVLDRTVQRHEPFAGSLDVHRTQSPPVRATVRATPLRAGDGRVTHYVWNLRAAVADEGTDAAIDAGIVSSDLADRLTSLVGNLELLAARADDPQTRKGLDAALRAAEGLVALLRRPA